MYDGVVVGADYPGTTWDESEGADLYRRSVYTFWKRTLPHPAMTVFDAPDREFCTTRRTTTEYAAAGADFAERPDVRRGRQKDGGANDPRGRGDGAFTD